MGKLEEAAKVGICARSCGRSGNGSGTDGTGIVERV